MDLAKQRLAHVLKAMSAGMWEWNVQTDELRLDPRWAQILGYELAELEPISGRTFVQLCHPDDLAESARRTQACLDGHIDQYLCESRMRHKDGHWVWVLDSGSVAERDAQGRPLKMIGARQDITPRKQAQAALHQESERFIALARVSNTGVWEWDQNRQYLWCSPEYFSMLGHDPQAYPRDGSPNLHDTWRALLHPDDGARASQCFADYLAAGAPGMYENEFRMRHANGGWVWIWSRGSALRDAQGQPTGKVMGTHINISSLKETQARLDELNAHLEQRVSQRTAELHAALEHLRQAQQELLQSEKLAALGALVAGVAHELNTPIGNAVTVASTLVQTHTRFADLVQTGLTRSAMATYLDDVREGGQIIERNLARAAQLIGSFKQLAVDQTSSQRRRFSLDELVQEITLAMRPTLRKTPVQLHTEIAPALTLDSYPGPLGQVLMNLINNALVHAFDGASSGHIRLTAVPEGGDALRLDVTDDGCGIALQNQQKVFDPFFTTRLGQGGSGLGLHITYTLVTGVLGGRIALHSRPGQGCRFTLHLPLQAPRTGGENNAVFA